jgi:hypothetical protein
LRTGLISTGNKCKVRPHNSLVWRSSWAMATMVVFIVVVFLSGTVVAAKGAMPDNFLYPVKQASEKVVYAFKSSTVSKLQYSAELANNRVSELIYVLSRNDVNSEQLDAAALRLESVLSQIESLAQEAENTGTAIGQATTNTATIKNEERARLIKALALYAVNNSAELQEGIQTAPDQVRPAVEKAAAALVDSYDKAIKAIEDSIK